MFEDYIDVGKIEYLLLVISNRFKWTSGDDFKIIHLIRFSFCCCCNTFKKYTPFNALLQNFGIQLLRLY